MKKTIIALAMSYAIMAFPLSINAQSSECPIEYIDLIHICHTDYGFTDNPEITQELHRKFLDIGIDAVLETVDNKKLPKFFWTAEALETVDTWWRLNTPQRRKELIRAIKSGQLEITAMPFNVHPFHNEAQVDKLTNWTSDELWNMFKPEVAMQNDVNGFPRSSAMKLMDKGIKYFWSGLNLHWGGIFHKPPYAFWWKMPDGRKALVWLGMSYWEGFDFFEPRQFRYAQRIASNTQFRTPRTGDMYKSDEASVREAHKVCIERINKMIQEGYPYDFISMTTTNQYRCDNDGPFPALAEFIAKWNELGLKPRINFTTAAESMKKIEKRIGSKIDVLSGEWSDWWSFGVASFPRELSASRQANLFLEAAKSPAWGAPPPNFYKQEDMITRDLCRFYEHTFASWESNSKPYSLYNQGHINTNITYAYRPYEKAQWLLAQRVRNRLTNEDEGLYVVNTGAMEYTGWVNIDPAAFVRQPYKSVIDPQTGKKHQLFLYDKMAKLWVNNLKPHEIYRWVFSTEEGEYNNPLSSPEIEINRTGWPTRIKWENHYEPFVSEGFGDLFTFNTLVGRSIVRAWYEPDPAVRKQKIAESSMENHSDFKYAVKTETPYSVIYTQEFIHKSVTKAKREIEIWKGIPKMSFKIVFDRLSNDDIEIMYVNFPFPKECEHPITSNGGVAFEPYKDQLPGTCTDYLAVDGYVKYPTKGGAWLWSSRDAALITFGGNQFGTKSTTAPTNINQLCAMVYNNQWEVNFLNNCVGTMEFKFDVMWTDNTNKSPKEICADTHTYLLEPVTFVNPATREDKHTFKNQHRIE